MDLSRFPKVSLGHFPTPLEPLPRLSRALGGPTIFIKRDDCTGLASGGNKTRKLEFLMAEAFDRKADMVITQGATQSNHARQTAAAAAKLGMKCEILLERRVETMGPEYEATGNVLLNDLFDAPYQFRPPGLDMNAEAEKLGEELREKGFNPYVIPGGGSNKTGALGYVNAAVELQSQVDDQGLNVSWLVHATGSTGTQAGLVAGLHAIESPIPVYGVSVRNPKEQQEDAVFALAAETADFIGAGDLPRSAVIADGDYVGEGYGLPADSTVEAILMLARLEGILLDPVYSGKGMAGLIGLIRQGFFKSDDNVVFLHTGGSAALFAYPQTFAPMRPESRVAASF